MHRPQVKEKKMNYKKLHELAWKSPRGFEMHIVRMFESLSGYAKCHRDAYHTTIGNDGVLGKSWKNSLIALRELLNGETGLLDCGTIDAMIMELARSNDVDLDD